MTPRGRSQPSTRMNEVTRIRQTARFGNFPIPEDMSPVDVLLDEMKRSAGFVFWIETKIFDWPDELVSLGHEHIDDKGAIQLIPTHEAGWISVWQAERKHLAYVAKLCIDAGITERQIALAEKQAEIMFTLINEALDMLRLTPEQQALVPRIMPALIRRVAIPGEVADRAAEA